MASFKIPAMKVVSLSEIQKVKPWFSKDHAMKYEEETNEILFDLGMDTSYKVDMQDCTHRNAFGEVVTTLRWCGEERSGQEWLQSGYASPEALDRGLNNKLLSDLYRLRGYVKE